jgi:phosphosulfolactate synthase
VRAPSFLDLPSREAKPRGRGITSVIDSGLPAREVADLLRSTAPYLDVWKLGWGTAYLDPDLGAKLAILRDHGVLACPGGTLLEIAAAQGQAEACLDWFGSAGFPCVEVSNGLEAMDTKDKHALIRRAARDFTVIAEVGAKDPWVVLEPSAWVDALARDLDAGARWVVTEGRESGTVGIYEEDGAVRGPLIEILVDRIGMDVLVFEAPRKDQQAWFVRELGPNVNLANVVPRETLGVEALRLGLRADTAAVAAAVACRT